MKKRSLIVAALCSMCLAVSTPMPVMADASKVVTLGADLTDEQKNTMMKYFKADANQVQIITVNNQDERNYLGKYISSEQIGTRTLSCAYVKPTQSGGIKVRTANLNYVTCNMLANALSTAGISNCEAVAACPYEVSGTGALTGVMMAYESASGKQLDSTKKDLATKEVVVTGDVAKQVGGDNATNIINQAKLQIIGDNVHADEIYNIVNNIAVQNNVSLSSDELTTITALLQEIVQQNYDIQDMKQTLESIQQNLNKTSDDDNSSESEDDMVDEDNSDGEDITEDVNTDVLGDDVKESYTEDAGMAEATGMTESENGDDSDSSDEGLGIPDATEDGTQDDYYEEPSETPEETDSVDGSDSSSDDGTGLPEENGEETGSTDENYGETTEENTDSSDQATTEGTDDALNTDSLDDASKAQFEQAKQFCQGEYKGDLAVLQAVVENAQQPTVTLDADTADKLTRKVLEAYLNVLKDGGVSYVPADTDVYMTAQLNMINNDMKKIFSIETEPAADDILVTRTADERQTLYNDTMKFFEKLYGETTDDSAQQESAGEASYDEESYNEESYNEETYNEETY